MHIVMIGPFGLQPLGTMRVRALPLAHALVRRGHRVHLLLPPWQNPKDAGRVWEDKGVVVENMALPAGIPGWFHWSLTQRLVRRTRELRPDVVHCFKPKAYAGLAHWALRSKFPVVVDTDDWEGAGGWNDLQDYPLVLQRFFAWQERFGLTKASAVTAASRALQTLAWSHGGKTERVVYVPNGVVLPNVDPSENTPPERPGALYSVGSNIKLNKNVLHGKQIPSPRVGEGQGEGGIRLYSTISPITSNAPERPTILLYTRFYTYSMDRLWQVLSRLRSGMPEIRVLVVGQGFNEEEDDLCARAQDAGWQVAHGQDLSVEADLLYTGYGRPEFVHQCFTQTTVGLYLFDDTLLNRTKCPVKLLDMLAAGVPVVGDSVGEIREMIAHGKSGMLVSAGDVNAMVDETLSLLRDPQRLWEMRAAAREDMQNRFSWDRIAEDAEQAYSYAVERLT